MAESQTTTEQQIATAAGRAASVNVDGTQTTAHSLPDQIAADKYLRANRGLRRRAGGLKLTKIIPHGSVQ